MAKAKPDVEPGEVVPVDGDPREHDPEELIEAASQELDVFAGEAVQAIDEADVFRAMSRADEDQILAEMQGRGVLAVMVYEFPQDGKKVRGLSYDGVRECVRTLNARGYTRMRTSAAAPPVVNEIVEDGQPYYRVMVYAEDEKTGSGAWGTAVQPKRMKLKETTANRYREQKRPVGDDNTIWDDFALAKALSKAQRNALEDLIPLELRETIIAQFAKDHERVRRITAGAGAEGLAELPPPLTTPEAEEKRALARALFGQIREISPTKYMIPGQFHALLTRSEWSLERLDEFIAQLQGLLDKARVDESNNDEGGKTND